MCLNQCVKGDKQNCEHIVRMILPVSVMNSRKKEFLKENFGLTVIFHNRIKFPSFFFFFFTFPPKQEKIHYDKAINGWKPLHQK